MMRWLRTTGRGSVSWPVRAFAAYRIVGQRQAPARVAHPVLATTAPEPRHRARDAAEDATAAAAPREHGGCRRSTASAPTATR